MDADFWLAAWRDGQTAFHREDPHEDLVAFAGEVFAPGGAVLVPLCGATVDLAWLADRGWRPIGVELSPLACEALAARDGLSPASPVGPFARWEGRGITLLRGDLFALRPEHVGPLAGVWDRAALVALRPDQRAEYARVLRAALDGGRLLLSTLAYPQAVADGPPWSVDGDAVRALWPEARALASREEPASPRLAALGVPAFEVGVWAT